MVGQITVQEFLERRAGGTAMTLVDVREDWEVELATAPSPHLHIPMDQIPERLQELPQDSEIVVLCRSGVRSLQVASFLERRGFASVYNLSGGILAWSREVDPRIPMY
jgi:rhodanese-related sulfurtransferase